MADARLTAVAHVLGVLDGHSLDRLLEQAPDNGDDRDRAFAAELSYGVCRWYRRLDALIRLLLTRPFRPRDRDLHVLLLVGAYQLLYSRVPDHAAVSTAVDACRRLGKGWAGKLVNGVLRRLSREREALERRVDTDIAVRFAQPAWLYEALRDAWPDVLLDVLAALQQRPPMVLRVDLRRTQRSDYAARLAAVGIPARPHPTVTTALLLDSAVPVTRLPGFETAVVSVQDAGAQLAARYLALRDGLAVLDACAAPGGKTLDILQRADGLDLTALDVDAGRLRRVEENLHRAQLAARLCVGDATQPEGTEWAQRRYDRILVDAPCSATGVLRRHPDIRLLRRAEDIPRLAARQSAMLDALWPLLQPGGRLLYVTCSLLPVENAQQIGRFIGRHADAAVVELPTATGRAAGKGVQLLPGIDATDGFFYAALEKTSIDRT